MGLAAPSPCFGGDRHNRGALAAREAASLLLEELAAAPLTRGRNAARDRVQDFLAEAEGELAQGHR